MVVAGYITLVLCFPNRNEIRSAVITSRPTLAERLLEKCEPYFPSIRTCLLILGIALVLGYISKMAVNNVLTYSPRFSHKERGQVTTSVPVLKQKHWYTTSNKVEYFIQESIRLESSPTICNIERDQFVFNYKSKAVDHAASRIGQNITVWRNRWDPTLCCDRACSGGHNQNLKFAWVWLGCMSILIPILVLLAWEQTGWWGYAKDCGTTVEQQQEEVHKLTLSDKYALFQVQSVTPKPRRDFLRRNLNRSDIEAPKNK